MTKFDPHRIVGCFHDFGVACEPEIDKTLDGGTCMIYENPDTGNELTFIISINEDKCWYAALRDQPKFRMVGEVRGADELKLLAAWFMGGMLPDGEVL